jgi:hypothetical protein
LCRAPVVASRTVRWISGTTAVRWWPWRRR